MWRVLGDLSSSPSARKKPVHQQRGFFLRQALVRGDMTEQATMVHPVAGLLLRARLAAQLRIGVRNISEGADLGSGRLGVAVVAPAIRGELLRRRRVQAVGKRSQPRGEDGCARPDDQPEAVHCINRRLEMPPPSRAILLGSEPDQRARIGRSAGFLTFLKWAEMKNVMVCR